MDTSRTIHNGRSSGRLKCAGTVASCAGEWLALKLKLHTKTLKEENDIRRTNGFSKMNEKEIKEGKVWEILIPQNHKIAGIENEYDECGKLTGSTATRRVEYELDLTFNRIRSPVLTAPPPGGSQKTSFNQSNRLSSRSLCTHTTTTVTTTTITATITSGLLLGSYAVANLSEEIYEEEAHSE
uniref:Uncharacterized protein n=1 Tax=Vespula pensylvanica TaxID=30213 RepID=A0A834PES2_VESPE|nr:hypothetical protein H0235_000884 [Vespula pensylvanica]